MKDEERVITRRDFLRDAAAATLALGLPAGAQTRAPSKRSRVVLVRDEKALNAQGQVNANVIQHMLDDAVCALVGKKDPVACWRTLVKPADLIGIKTNHWSSLATPKEVENAIQRRVADAGVARERIRVTDRDCRTMLSDCTALINARPARSHHWAGMGGCIKNYIIFDPNPSRHHPDACDDLATVWSLPAVKGKTRLNILVVLTPLFHGRGPHHYDPRYVWDYKGILVSFDPVAIDAVGAHLLSIKRLAALKEDRPATPTNHITSADRKYHLGVSDLNRIELIKLGWKKQVLI